MLDRRAARFRFVHSVKIAAEELWIEDPVERYALNGLNVMTMTKKNALKPPAAAETEAKPSTIKLFMSEHGVAVLSAVFAANIALFAYLIKESTAHSAIAAGVKASVDGLNVRLDDKASAITLRIDRIANAMPGIHAKVAREEVDRPIRMAIVVSDPYKAKDGSIEKRISLVNPIEGLSTTFQVLVKGASDDQVETVAAGLARRFDATAVSFAELDAFAVEAGETYRSPQQIDPVNSYVLRTMSSVSSAAAAAALASRFVLLKGETVRLKSPGIAFSDYAATLKSMEKNGELGKLAEIPASYKVVQPGKP